MPSYGRNRRRWTVPRRQAAAAQAAVDQQIAQVKSLQATLDQDKADQQSSQAQADQTADNLRRQQDLYNHHVVSIQDLTPFSGCESLRPGKPGFGKNEGASRPRRS